MVIFLSPVGLAVTSVPVVLSVVLAIVALLNRKDSGIPVAALAVAVVNLGSGLVFGLLAGSWLSIFPVLVFLAAIILTFLLAASRFPKQRILINLSGVALALVLIWTDLRFSVVARDTSGRPVAEHPFTMVCQSWWSGYREVKTKTNRWGWGYVGFQRWYQFQNQWKLALPSGQITTQSNLGFKQWPYKVTVNQAPPP
jgi:hypothetical protein